MSETTSTPDGNPSDAPSSSAVDTPAAAPPPAAAPDSSTPPSSGKTDSSTSPSSGDSRQSDREGLLEAVRKVVPVRPEKPALDPSESGQEEDLPAASQADADQDKPSEPADQDKDKVAAPGESGDKPAEDISDLPDPTEGELRKLRPETRRRFERLLAQRNEARKNFESVQPELTQYRQLQGYLQQNQLAPDDVNVTLDVLATLRRGDFQGFLNGVTPYVLAAQEALGIRISSDIQKQVDDGLISEDAAREMTRTRFRAHQAEARLQNERQTVTSDTQNRTIADIKAGVDEWEANIRKRDPDWTHKQVAVRRFSQALLQERGYPTTRQQAVQMAQMAYDEASRELARMRPQPQPTRIAPSSNHVATNGASPPPSTMKDAALQALQAMRRAN